MDYPKSVPNVGLVNGKFVDENTTTGQVGSLIPAAWGSAVTDELLAVIRAAELEPTEGDNDQLLQALQAIVSAAIPSAPDQASESVAGVVKLVSDALMAAGVDDAAAVTLKKLVGKLVSQGYTAFTTSGVAAAYTLVPVPALAGYAENQRFRVKFDRAGAGATTLNISGRGAKRLKQYDPGGNKVDAVLAAGQLSDVEYDGAEFVILNALPPLADTLSTLRQTIATATQIDLGAISPATQHVNISGAGTISGFTVAPGKCYFVRFASAITLVNSAAIITQSGSNIVAQAGDTCVIRATAANTVEVLMYTPAVIQAIGYGQTWQDVITSRALGTTYTNSTGRPIAVSVTVIGGSPGLQLLINGLIVSRQHTAAVSGSIYSNLQAVIPPGATYSAVLIGGSLSTWTELR